MIEWWHAINAQDMKCFIQISSKRLKCEMCQKAVKKVIICKKNFNHLQVLGTSEPEEAPQWHRWKKKVLLLKMDTYS